jgi:hypothetical protein
MKRFFGGYQAPSTANENPDDPLLSIGGIGPIEAIPLDDFLPQRLFIRVTYRPIVCTHPTSISLTTEDGQLLKKSLYEGNKDILEALELVNTHKNFYDFKDATFPMDNSSPFQCTQDIVFRMSFQTLTESRNVEIAHDPLPYGGKVHWNPFFCQQHFFQTQDEGGAVLIYALSIQEYATEPFYPSLGHLIEGQKITIPLTFAKETYTYRSFSYKIIDEKELSLCFIR